MLVVNGKKAVVVAGASVVTGLALAAIREHSDLHVRTTHP